MFSALSSIENEFLEEVDKNGGILYHDYSNELHYKYILKTLGGEDNLKNNYPLVLKLIEKTKKLHEMGNGKTKTMSQSSDPSEDGFDDSIKVNSIQYDTQNVITSMGADFKSLKPSIAISARLMDKTHDKIVDVLNICGDDDINELEGEIKKLTSELIQAADVEFSTIADFYWMEESDDLGLMTSSCTTKYNDFKVEGTDTIVADFVVNDPIAKKTPSRDHVVVVYNREAQVGDDYDYDFDNNKFKQGDREYVKIYLPTSGTVTLSNDFIVLGLNKDMGCVLQIEDLNKGVVNYYSGFDTITTTISADKKKITWTYQDYWNNNLDVSNFGAKTTVNIYNKMELNIQKVSTGMNMHIPVVFQSNGTQSQDKASIISKPIMIQWGCLGKDSKILMADYTYKIVTEIKIGDLILNEKMETIKIKDIYTGPEIDMVLIETVENKKILVTSGHAVCTDRGFVAANKINASDKIKTVDGYEEIKDLLTVPYNDTVYSLSLESENAIICDGIIVGDFSMQQNLKEDKKLREVIVRSKDCINARNEFRQLFNSMNESKA